LLVVSHLGLFVLAMSIGPIGWMDDPTRFSEIAASGMTPYREQPLEYMPGELLFILGTARGSASNTVTWLAMLALLGDLAAAAGIAYGWGARASVAYLAITLMMLPFLFFRFDLVVVALASWGTALVVRRRDAPGGATLAPAI